MIVPAAAAGKLRSTSVGGDKASAMVMRGEVPAGPSFSDVASMSAQAADHVHQMYASVPHLSDGAWDTGSGGMAALHTGEMVIPQSYASGLRSGASGGSTTNNATTNNVVTFNHNPTVAPGGGDVSAQLKASDSSLRSWVGSTVRNGNLIPPRYS